MKNVKNFKNYINESNEESYIEVTDELIESVRKEMRSFYAIDLTYEQTKEYLDSKNLQTFDTWEREDFGHFLAKKITGMEWPANMDSSEYTQKFFNKLIENAPKMGYKLI